MSQIVYILLGWIALGLGGVGVFLPLLPTTPFVLLAAFFFSKGSPRLHSWLLSSKLFGPTLHNWEKNGSISIRAKWTATLLLVGLISYAVIGLPVLIVVKILLLLIMVSVLTFIWTRPSTHA